MAQNRRFERVLSPILDVMQITPTFSYLAPLVLLFGIGGASATIVTLIYALPATIRITALGIREVPRASVEAADSLGATAWQRLRKVRLPLAGRAIGLAVNQTLMLALSMIVITALIDAPGWARSDRVPQPERHRPDGADAGIAIVILAIVLDRLSEQASRRPGPAGAVTGTGVAGGASDRRLRASRSAGIALGLLVPAARGVPGRHQRLGPRAGERVRGLAAERRRVADHRRQGRDHVRLPEPAPDGARTVALVARRRRSSRCSRGSSAAPDRRSSRASGSS